MKLEVMARLKRGTCDLDLAFTLEERVTGVFGPSGSGKTTLLHIIAGLVRPREGRIALDGAVFLDSNAGVFLAPQHRRMGMVFQDGRLFPHMTVRDNLLYGARLLTARQRRFQLGEVVDLLELEPHLDRRPGVLSGGEAQRVALGRAILGSPHLLLLDEPLASLDRRMKQQITPFLRRIRDTLQIPMLYVSHDPRDILDLTNRFVVLDRGKLAGQGNLLDLAMNPRTLGLLEDDGLTNILPLTLMDQAPDQGVSCFTLSPAATICGPTFQAPAGTVVHAEIRPDDIALAGNRIEGISIRNQVPGRVIRLSATPSREVCIVDIGVPVIVEITRPAFRALNLDVGSPVWCLFKARAVRYREAEASGDGRQGRAGSLPASTDDGPRTSWPDRGGRPLQTPG